MAHRKEEGGWHVWITGSVGAGGEGAGEPKAGDNGGQDEVGLGEASHRLKGFPTICWRSAVFESSDARKEEVRVRDQCLASLGNVEKRSLGEL